MYARLRSQSISLLRPSSTTAVHKMLLRTALIAVTAAALIFATPDAASPTRRAHASASPTPRLFQMVLMTFDDAVRADNYEFYDEAFAGKKNPDGCPVSATFFTAHEYTDYERLHMLYAKGHEIALHSISHESQTEYWKNAKLSVLRQELSDERELIAHFANIPKDAIQGIRMPFLQLSGNTSFQLIKEDNLTYDCSWPTQRFIDPPLWPYTLDYASGQDCIIPPCPNEAFAGVWVVPMVDWTDNSGQFCPMVDGCQDIEHSVDGLLDFMKRNFERHYSTSRAPLGFFVHAAWFLTDETHFEAYKKFIDFLLSKKDVYIVNIQRMLQWMENPQPIGNLTTSWPKCQPTFEPSCSNVTCYVKKGEEERVMKQCSTCPKVYPWLGNPLGK